MRQADQTPFAPDSRQATQQKATEPPASLIWPNTGSTITLRLAYTALPAGVCTFAAMRSCTVAGVSGASA